MLGSRYKSVNLSAKTRQGPPNRCAQRDWKGRGPAATSATLSPVSVGPGSWAPTVHDDQTEEAAEDSDLDRRRAREDASPCTTNTTCTQFSERMALERGCGGHSSGGVRPPRPRTCIFNLCFSLFAPRHCSAARLMDLCYGPSVSTRERSANAIEAVLTVRSCGDARAPCGSQSGMLTMLKLTCCVSGLNPSTSELRRDRAPQTGEPG